MNDHFEVIEPNAASLAESLRAFSYDLPTAIADLVDNSVTAGARNIWIDFHWDGAASMITITDDGSGMSETELVNAMRPGSKNPLEQRENHDLGRFGLGLKTASFSQCRRVTVNTCTSGGSWHARRWDLDHISQVNAWQLIRPKESPPDTVRKRQLHLACGTSITWQKIDRVISASHVDDTLAQQQFLSQVKHVCDHLEMVFHSIMEGKAAMKIFVNGRRLIPWDPFLEAEAATQILPKSKIAINGHQIEVQPYVLPHHSKVSKSKHEAAAGPKGWNSHQGFFVYRNDRLLVAGGWLGLGWKREDHYKLCRIRIDITNQLDAQWGIDVTKSRARPPASIRGELRAIAERCRSEGRRVYSHRGAKLTKNAAEPRVFLWEPLAKHDKTFYRLNREHPLIARAIQSSSDRSALNAVLRLIEETIPVPHITLSNSENPSGISSPFEKCKQTEIRSVMEEAFASLVDSGYPEREAGLRLATIWPFELFPEILESLIEERNHS